MKHITLFEPNKEPINENVVPFYKFTLAYQPDGVWKNKILEAKSSSNSTILYHGSPHAFDKFSMDAIGTGEGNQVFGWGIYFTDNKDIAIEYAHSLFSNKDIVDRNKQLKGIYVEYPIFSRLSDNYFKNIRNIILNSQPNKFEDIKKTCIKLLIDYIAPSNKWIENENGDPVREYEYVSEVAAKIVDEISEARISRNLYTVTTRLDKCRWYEWYNLVDTVEAKRIKDAALENGVNLPFDIENEEGQDYAIGIIHGNKTFLENYDDFYKFLEHNLKSQKEASMLLMRVGYTGIKYPVNTYKIKTKILSNTSTNYNYVLFNVDLIKKVARKLI